MNYYQLLLKNLLFLFFLLAAHCCFSQEKEDEFFTNFSLIDRVWNHDRWSSDLNGHWKNSYQGAEWTRAGLDASVNYKVSNWTLKGGLVNNYTFDKEISNYYELRPWLGVKLQTPITDVLKFNQQFKTEGRFFFYDSSSEVSSDRQNRNRYNIGLEWTFDKNDEKATEWALEPEVEWYLLQEPLTGERFANSHEYTLSVVRKFSNGHSLIIGYTQEGYNELFNEKDKIGHTLDIKYKL